LDGTLVAYFLTCSVTSHFVEPKSVVVVDDGEFARLLELGAKPLSDNVLEIESWHRAQPDFTYDGREAPAHWYAGFK
jgi:hypothetical protein